MPVFISPFTSRHFSVIVTKTTLPAFDQQLHCFVKRLLIYTDTRYTLIHIHQITEMQSIVKDLYAKRGVLDVNPAEDATTGSMRLVADARQTAGILMILGTCALFQPLANIASILGPTSYEKGISFSALLGGLCLVLIGVMTMATGYLQLVHDRGYIWLTASMIVVTFLATIPYVTDLVDVSLMAKSGQGFIPIEYNPTPGQVHFVGALGILAVLAYAFSFIGSIVNMQFTLYKFQIGNPRDRSSGYYKRRMLQYTVCLLVAGSTQLLLGLYAIQYCETGLLSYGPIIVSIYVVYFPVICVLVGAMQVAMAWWGYARTENIGVFGKEDMSYQVAMFCSWFLQFLLQVMVQIGYAPGTALAGAVPSVTAMTLGLNIMPAYLDWKYRVTPRRIRSKYYDLPSSSQISEASVHTVMEIDI
jgi:hypothetical protein